MHKPLIEILNSISGDSMSLCSQSYRVTIKLVANREMLETYTFNKLEYDLRMLRFDFDCVEYFSFVVVSDVNDSFTELTKHLMDVSN
jgi:hypothetical protein